MIFWGLGGIALLTYIDPVVPEGGNGVLLRAWGQFTPEAAFWFAGQVFVSAVGVYGLTRAYQLAEASYVAVFEYSFLVFAAIWAVILLMNIPTSTELAGMLMILGSGILIASSPAARKLAG